MVVHRPASTEELSSVVKDLGPSYIGDLSDFRNLLTEKFSDHVSLAGLNGVVEVEPADQIAVIKAGTPLSEINVHLGKYGFLLPVDFSSIGGFSQLQNASIGDLIALNIPNPREGLHGSWSDMILGTTLVLADGTIVKAGSRAVKNVAGYDLQKLLVGSRHTLAIATEYILRIAPLKGYKSVNPSQGSSSGCPVVQRVKRSDLTEAISEYVEGSVRWVDPTAATIYSVVEPDVSICRFAGDWILRSGCGANNLVIENETLKKFMTRAKEIFDPAGRLNPGEFGFI